MKKPAMIVLDLDGTLLGSSSRVPQRNAAALIACHDRGIAVAYITGRAPRLAASMLADLPHDAVAYYDGALIYAGERLLAARRIPADQGRALVCGVLTADPDALVTADCYPERYFNTPPRTARPGYFQSDFTDRPAADIERIIIRSGQPGAILPLVPETMAAYHSRSGGTVVIIHRDAGKETALMTIAGALGIEPARCLAFGDDANDLGLFAACGAAVAMANAIPELKAAARYITASNDEDGVAVFLEEYVLRELE